MLDSPAKLCPICGVALRGGQVSACSGRCRAAKSRLGRIPLPAQDARVLRDAIFTLLDPAWELKVTLEQYLGK